MPRKEDAVPPLLLAVYVLLQIFSGVANSLSYKKMLNAFKSQDPVNHPHNYEFFVNEMNVAMYFVLALVIVWYKRYCKRGGEHWLEKQTFYCRQYTMMGFLDSFAGFLSCVGGAFVAGAVQSLINQVSHWQKVDEGSDFTKRRQYTCLPWLASLVAQY
jgi:hypothetical protein